MPEYCIGDPRRISDSVPANPEFIPTAENWEASVGVWPWDPHLSIPWEAFGGQYITMSGNWI